MKYAGHVQNVRYGTVSCLLNTHVDICKEEGSPFYKYWYLNITHGEHRKNDGLEMYSR
jgi:hypothetical protein